MAERPPGDTCFPCAVSGAIWERLLPNVPRPDLQEWLCDAARGLGTFAQAAWNHIEAAGKSAAETGSALLRFGPCAAC